MHCSICLCLVTQEQADLAAEIAGPGHETLCEDCARSLAQSIDTEDTDQE